MSNTPSSESRPHLGRILGSPDLGSSPFGGPPKDPISQCDPGTVAIVAHLPNSSTGALETVLVGRVETRDLRATDPTANPRWEEVWNVERWDLFKSGDQALSLALAEKGVIYDQPLPQPTASWHKATLLYNYIAFTDEQARKLGTGLSGSAQYFEAWNEDSVTGWLYRSSMMGNTFTDLWVLKAGYDAPDESHDVKLAPRTNPYASATAFLKAVNTQRNGESGWLAVKVLSAFG